jgi:hypothetical protein
MPEKGVRARRWLPTDPTACARPDGIVKAYCVPISCVSNFVIPFDQFERLYYRFEYFFSTGNCLKSI